jgi:hypothetical protein
MNVHDYGARGDGVTDDTAAIAHAIADAGRLRQTLHFPGGVYLVTGKIAGPGFTTYDLQGESPARGCNAPEAFAASTIKFRPRDLAAWLIEAYRVGPEAPWMIGPYHHANLRFDLGDANGIRFGQRDSDGDGVPNVVEDVPAASPRQSFVVGVRFTGCAFAATPADRVSRDGVLTRSGRVLLEMTKCFESTVENTSFAGGDTQVRLWGCDTPVFAGCRSQLSHLPFDGMGSGTFSRKYTIRDLEVEGYTFAAVRSRDCELMLASCSIEQNDGAPVGGGRYSLTDNLGITAAVARGGTTLTFSRAMDGLLAPGLSILEVAHDGQRVPALVEAVSGTAVAVRPATFFPWSDPRAVVTRIHGYGVVHDSHADASLVGCGGSFGVDCPAFVWVLGRGSMHVAGGIGTPGASGDNRSLVIGNRLLHQFYLSSRMSFTGTTPGIGAPPGHPLVTVSDVSDDYGASTLAPNNRLAFGPLAEALAVTHRAWAFRPGRAGSYMNTTGDTVVPFVEVPGDPHTAQRVWAWQLGAPGLNQGLLVVDPTLPNDPTMHLRIRFRARSTGAAGTLKYQFLGRPWDVASAWSSLALTARWRTYEIVVPCPVEWRSPDRGDTTGLYLMSEACLLAGVTVEEIPPAIAPPRRQPRPG